VDIDELHITASVRINGVKDGLEQVRHGTASVGVNEASVGNLERIATILTSASVCHPCRSRGTR
jgi:thiamine phosphate synthase YjbQ (UPF0047 family)